MIAGIAGDWGTGLFDSGVVVFGEDFCFVDLLLWCLTFLLLLFIFCFIFCLLSLIFYLLSFCFCFCFSFSTAISLFLYVTTSLLSITITILPSSYSPRFGSTLVVSYLLCLFMLRKAGEVEERRKGNWRWRWRWRWWIGPSSCQRGWSRLFEDMQQANQKTRQELRLQQA